MSGRVRSGTLRSPARRVYRRQSSAHRRPTSANRRSTSASRVAAAALVRTAAQVSRARAGVGVARAGLGVVSGRRRTRSRTRNRPPPVSPPRQAAPAPPRASDDVIDLTDNDWPVCDDVVDLTSPTSSHGVNDSAIVVIGQSHRERSRTHADLSTLILSSDSSDSDSDELPELNIPKQTVPTTPIQLPPQKPISADSPQLACPICMDDYKEIKSRKSHLASTTCGHIFCTECIQNAVTSHKQCPLCRTKLKRKDYHTIHL